ncbi:uncharacterized protein BJ212DRAFT_1489015 [Suillus subaureus]|uniref:Uncharacterized protein n=1 Tax=Suillus subaureus TaxID=48587 RepID=A0A9P7DKS8_9AGAM|nr:uncharacterized protein BJ212DRAFT_1489015 [Suillus subaureus]KAG1797277.1 hypothetical protein BJ212DRAFT_1489015 [Suillus subaureus]
MSSDGKYIASAGLDAKVYVWSVEAALKQQGGTDDVNVKPDTKSKRHPIQLRDSHPIIAKQLANNRGIGRYRYGITPESDAEAAAAMQCTDGNETDIPAQLAQPAVGIQGYEGQPTETQGSSGRTGEVSYEVNCCGFFFGHCCPTSHRL